MNIHCLGKHIFIFLTIFLLGNSSVMFGTTENYNYVLVTYGYSAAVVIFLIILKNRINKDSLLLLLIMYLIIIASCIINREFNRSNLIIALLIIEAALLTEYINFESFACYFDNILYFLAVISLVGTALYYIKPSLVSGFPVIINSVGAKYYNGFFYVWEVGTSFFRNQGLFREPGVYQFYLGLGIFFQLFCLKCKINRIIIYSLVLVTTFSTTGYVVLLIFWIVIIFDKDLFKGKYIYKLSLVMVFILAIVYVLLNNSEFLFGDYYSSGNYSVFGKIKSIKLIGPVEEIGGASVARIASVVMNSYIGLNNPLFGVGIMNMSKMYLVLSMQFYHAELTYSTETLFYQAARFGVPYFLIWGYGYYNLIKKIKSNMFEIILIGLFFGIGLCTECYIYNIIVYLLLFYGYGFRREDRSNANTLVDKH